MKINSLKKLKKIIHKYSLFSYCWKNILPTKEYRRGFLRNYNCKIKFCKENLKSFCSKKEEITNEEEEYNLREIQLNPRYEAAIGFFVTGDYENCLKTLNVLKNNYRDEGKHYSEDYLFLLRKMITINKINKNVQPINALSTEIKDISLKIYKTDFNKLFEVLENIVLNLIICDQKASIELIEEILSVSILPNFFDHIFKYYQGSAYILLGQNLESAVEILDSIENEIEDNYLRACVYNNKALAIWWTTTQKYNRSIEENNGISFQLIQDLANEMIKISKIFKEALINLEDIKDFKYDSEYTYQDNPENKRLNFLSFILTKSFDKSVKIDQKFLKAFGEWKESLVTNKASAVVLSNLGELYSNIKDYKKSLIFLNGANLYFQNNNKNDPMFYKNLGLVAMNTWKLTLAGESTKKLFDKVINQMKAFPASYEKVYVLRLYSEMLLEENPKSILGNNLHQEANNLEKNLPNFESRKIYLILPSDN